MKFHLITYLHIFHPICTYYKPRLDEFGQSKRETQEKNTFLFNLLRKIFSKFYLIIFTSSFSLFRKLGYLNYYTENKQNFVNNSF